MAATKNNWHKCEGAFICSINHDHNKNALIRLENCPPKYFYVNFFFIIWGFLIILTKENLVLKWKTHKKMKINLLFFKKKSVF